MKKDIVLFVNAIRGITYDAIKDYNDTVGHTITPVIIVDEKIKDDIYERNAQNYKEHGLTSVVADFDDLNSLTAAITPFKDRILAITSQYENSIHELIKLVPSVPFLPMPTPQSLIAATEKKIMRDHVNAKHSDINPRYILITDSSEETIKEIEDVIPYPVIIKPSGLEGSLLVSLANNRQELIDLLENTFAEIQKAYDTWIKRNTPAILIEEFMDGDMYSIDSYINSKGEYKHTPLVRVFTGRNVGFEDFFGYMQITPAHVSEAETTKAQQTVKKACDALGLRSVTAHVELMHTKNGWKVIEIGPRVGGYRHNLYISSYGINHVVNDFLNRADIDPIINNEARGYTTLLKLYSRKEGQLKEITGKENVEQLESFVSIKQDVHIGDDVRFAKNNGDPVFEVVLFNALYDKLLDDVATIEKQLHFEVA